LPKSKTKVRRSCIVHRLCFSVPAAFAGGGTAPATRRWVTVPSWAGARRRLCPYWFLTVSRPAPWLSVPSLLRMATRWLAAVSIHEDVDGRERVKPAGQPCQKSSRGTQFEAACRRPHPPSGSCLLHRASAVRCHAHPPVASPPPCPFHLL
ncbi:hypothetical protein BAE44_0003242, partial [Dichanthelium oligosanthes]